MSGAMNILVAATDNGRNLRAKKTTAVAETSSSARRNTRPVRARGIAKPRSPFRAEPAPVIASWTA
jgi:hypothetical protein